MNTTKKTILSVTVAAAFACITALTLQGATPPAAKRDPLVASGEHLVRHVALCADCHGPRLPTGALDETRWLQGAPIGFKPLVEMPWSPVAPPLASLPGRSDADVVALLKTGRRLDGTAPLPPMPAFALTEDEARAVVAYLRSLAPAK